MEPSPGLEPAMTKYYTTVLNIDRGTRHNAAQNVDWPVVDRINRFCRPGERPTWTALRGLCNGVSDNYRDFKTLKDAKAWLGV